MNRLEGKTAIVTGAGRGIGKAIAILFAQEGANVGVLSRTPASVDQVVGEIMSRGGSAIALPCDIGYADQINAAVDKIVAASGHIDILVNNAFDMSSAMSSVIDLSVAQLQAQFDTGPIAMLRTMQACYPHMKGREGRVINFASATGIKGAAGFAPYAMAKEAIRALTRVAANEWGKDGITVNNILPIAKSAAYDTAVAATEWVPDTPLSRMGLPEEDIAPVALFLASADARFMTGYSLAPDGGFLIDSAR